MAACVVVTLPLELVVGARVWREPARLLRSVGPVLIAFATWDAFAIERAHWSFSARYTTGWEIPLHLPVEEIIFFAVIPVCALLTFEAVDRLVGTR